MQFYILLLASLLATALFVPLMSKTWRCCLSLNHPQATVIRLTHSHNLTNKELNKFSASFNFSKDHLSSRKNLEKEMAAPPPGVKDKKVGLPRKNTTRSVIWKASVLESCQYKGLQGLRVKGQIVELWPPKSEADIFLFLIQCKIDISWIWKLNEWIGFIILRIQGWFYQGLDYYSKWLVEQSKSLLL